LNSGPPAWQAGALIAWACSQMLGTEPGPHECRQASTTKHQPIL
jgi:hypothetical protein